MAWAPPIQIIGTSPAASTATRQRPAMRRRRLITARPVTIERAEASGVRIVTSPVPFIVLGRIPRGGFDRRSIVGVRGPGAVRQILRCRQRTDRHAADAFRAARAGPSRGRLVSGPLQPVGRYPPGPPTRVRPALP